MNMPPIIILRLKALGFCKRSESQLLRLTRNTSRKIKKIIIEAICLEGLVTLASIIMTTKLPAQMSAGSFWE